MGKLMQQFREQMAKDKNTKALLNEAEMEVAYSTGFLTIDYLNGTMIHVNGNDIQDQYQSIGLMDGSSYTFISRPKCGKSTLVTQIIGNILKAFPESDAYIDDIEGSLPLSRKEFLLNLAEEDLRERVHFRNTDITTENVYTQIKSIHDIKVANRKSFEYDTKLYDIFGNRIFKLIPTLYFIDSFAMLMPEDIATDTEIGNNMTGSSTAKQNTMMIKKISQLLKSANIILFCINHIQDDIQIGFMPKPQQISGLKQGERITGGKTALYLANGMFRLDEHGQLKEEEGFGIKGTVVDFTIIKSRTNADKRSVPLIFNKTLGAFDNILSIFYFLKEQGAISGAGRSLYFEANPDIKFSQKEFKNELMRNSDLQKVFAKTAKENLIPMLSDTKNQTVEDDAAVDINSLILSI